MCVRVKSQSLAGLGFALADLGCGIAGATVTQNAHLRGIHPVMPRAMIATRKRVKATLQKTSSRKVRQRAEKTERR